MRTINASMDKFIRYIADKDLYIYGVGDIYHQLIKKDIYREIHKRVAGYMDNGKAGSEICVFRKQYFIHGMDLIKNAGEGVVLLCGVRYLDEMYRVLCEQNLPDSVVCFVLPLIWTVTDGEGTLEGLCRNGNMIEKRIHCFWFSRDRKPCEYQRCMDSWKRVCPDYEITEWSADTYDCGKNLFVKQAYEKKKWAFVSDYARLDVIYHYGGIYLDMDVELLKDFKPLLGYRAFFNFGTRYDIDLGSGFGSIRHNPFLKKLMEFYEGKEFLDKSGNPLVDRFVQPALLRKMFPEWGFTLNGSLQVVDDMLVLPRRYYTPVDDFLLQSYVRCRDTRGIHHYHAGWYTKEYHEERQSHQAWAELAKKVVL